MNNKFIKLIIVVNGILLFFVLIFALVNITKDFFSNRNKYDEGLYIGEKIEKAKEKKVALQGLRYYTPSSLYNSSNSYLPISLLTYEEEKAIYEAASVANDIGSSLLKYVNVVFLDENYQLIGSLLDKKASILEIEPQRDSNYNDNKVDETVKYIAYLIAFEDSNKDGKLNSADNHDLYISDLNGKNLQKITHNLNIDRFEFKKSNSQIFIKYTSRENIREEHKKQDFAIYNIEEGKFVNLKSLNNELNNLEKIIIN